LEGGDLRYVRLGDVEIVRRLYIAIRDRNWGTIPPVYTRFDLLDEGDHFRIDLAAEHLSGDVDFAWTGSIEGHANGTISYSMEGTPRKAFLRNRIGFCVLHPSDLAGVSARAETPEGTVERSFPDLISPHQPFVDMISISHPVGTTATATITFEGDLFEMEDQRNWTDASFKTYSTPLRLPYPVEVSGADRIDQRVTISATGVADREARQAGESRPHVSVSIDALTPLPEIGFGAGLSGTISTEDMRRFHALAPAHLRVNLDLGADDWRDELADASNRAIALATTLDLSVTAGPTEASWHELTAAIQHIVAPIGRVFAFPLADTPITFPRSDLATHPKTIVAAREAFATAGIDVTLGGGTKAYFTELNRSSDFLPVHHLDTVTYTLNPQVHASDNLSVIETLMVQGETVRSARALVGDRELVVGPITLQPPFNPNATGPAPATPDDRLPPAVDARQLSLLGAGWTVGSLHQLAAAGVDALTFYELYGWRGLSERRSDLTRRTLFPSDPGQLFPLFHVFAATAEFAGGSVANVALSDALRLEALALRKDDRVRLLVASFAEEPATFVLSVPGLADASIRHLDEQTYDAAMDDPDFFRRYGSTSINLDEGEVAIELLPFALACIDGRAG
ncbi:MAG: hypothetical protein AB7V46_11365, partial [Thermomicrobiales bacterium]